MDRYEELLRYVEAQIKVFNVMPLKSEFNDGVIEGLNLVKVYLNARMENEGARIAEAFDAK